MSQVIEGQVTNLYSKSKMSRAGKPFNIWYANVEGTEVNLGFKTNLSEGMQVKLPVKEAYGELKLDDTGNAGSGASSGGSSPAPAAAKAPPFKGGRNMGSFPVDKSDGQMSIIRQSSLNRAIDFVFGNALFSKLTEEELEAKVFEYAYKFTDFSSGQREKKMVAQAMGMEE